MFLKSLTLKGFKSFADSTTLVFEPGITVVVGPNGSGKSNVVDAVAWVLGAQGPRTVRSTKMEDVIFAGSAKRPALGRAEVTLTIDNSAGILPIDFAEVTISRTLFRASGESEYAINDVPCRLLDIQELLSDSGVGRQQHVIVSQGQLDAVLNARPEDRRAIIEEAAGVLKFRRRREKAQRRLESTEGNLVRLNDLLREVRRQLKPLERQADAARRHGAVAEELEALKIFLAGREVATLTARLKAADEARSTQAKDDRDLRDELFRLDALVTASETELDAARGDELADLAVRVESALSKANSLRTTATERGRTAAAELAAAIDQTVVATLEADSARIASELTEVDAAIAALPASAGDEAAPSDDELDAPRRVAEMRGEATALAAALEAANGKAASAAAKLESATAAHAQLTERLTAATDRATNAAGAVADAEIAVAQAQVGNDAATEARESALAQHRSAQERKARADGRRDALAAALDTARARAGAAQLEGLDGVLGTLLDLVDVEDGWQAAFEAAIGEAITAVVVDSETAGRAALLKLAQASDDASVGGAVLALSATSVPGSLGLAASAIGAEAVRAHVRSRHEEVERLLDVLLAVAVAVDGDWTAALDVVLAHPGVIAVTRHGDRFSSAGWRVGAGGVGATGAALEAAAVEADAATVGEHAAAQAFAAADEAFRAGSRQLELARRAFADASREVGDAERARDALRAQVAAREAELAAATTTHAEATAAIERDTQRLAALRAALTPLEETARRVEESQRLFSEFEVERSTLASRRKALVARQSDVEARLARLAGDREAVASRREAIEERIAKCERIAARMADRAAWLSDYRDRLRRERDQYAAGRRETLDRLESLRRERTDAERRLNETRERAQRAELEAAEVRVRLDTVIESVRAEHNLEPEQVVEALLPDLAPGVNPANRARELERELKLMGPINPLALEEHAALAERHEFLESQLEDVKNSRRELAKVIKAIDTEIIDLFAAAYVDVADNFEKLFSTLFPGGTGRLRLTDPDHPLDTGIEVEARPSGKNVRRLSLLSGGERSLTALAFLFAVFRSRPSPFYLMDEVEAALDDVNLHRFIDLIHEFRQEAQLVIVSHQKRTMEAADCLYGVTMVPGGSSKVVSEKLETVKTETPEAAVL
ncbi:MAG TPA: chromosome segregation protein SMC [Acidimicrobiales bacterium]|nr:chromosome segregation protein SMC [Acidimicrobiales bacterium]